MSLTKHFKYQYHPGKATTDHGTRMYEVQGFRMPSVTTILAQTKDDEYIRTWRNKIGHEEADRIFNLSSKRGTAMHKFLEKYIQGTGYDDLTEIGVQAKPMAQKIIDVGLTPVSVYYGSEVTLHYPGLYAGQTDLVGVHKGKDAIIDFKQTNKPKKREWISDYFSQLSAYAMAHNFIYKTKITKGVIMMSSKDHYYQEFVVEGKEFQKYKHNFLRRVDEYYQTRSKKTG